MNGVASNLLSGLIGALIGAFISFYIYRRNRRDAARQKLLTLVYRLGFESWWNPETGKPAIIFHDNYPSLWEAYEQLRHCLPIWKRKRLDQAWHKYMSNEYYDEIPDDQIGKVFQKGTFTTRDQAVKASQEFVSFLTRMR